jgi:Mitochondrial carrier protein
MQTPRKQTTQRLLAGGAAGVLSRSMVAPLERLRTIMMASASPLTAREAVTAMWHDGGLPGLFKGNMASVVKVLPSAAIQFAVYDGVSDVLKSLRPPNVKKSTEMLDRLAAGVVAGAASCVVTYPLETVRTMMCVPCVSQGSFLEVRTVPVPCDCSADRGLQPALGSLHVHRAACCFLKTCSQAPLRQSPL